MSEEHAEVRAKLTLEDQAHAGLEKVKQGFEHLGEKVHEVQHEMLGMARQAIATAAGFELFHGIESIKELGEEFFGAALGAQAEEKALSQVMAVNDRTGKSFFELKDDAHELHEELEAMGIEAGQSTGSLMEAFGDIAARSKKSTEEVKEFVSAIAEAGKVTRGGVSGLSEGFANMELGIIRARNPVVQLVAQMHLLKGNSKQVAAQMMKMTPDKAMELGEEAIRRMAEKAKSMPLTFRQVVQSLKDIRENVFETTGIPILTAITKPLKELRQYMLDNKATIDAWAQNAGVKLSEMIGKGANLLKDAFRYLDEHGSELADAISEAAHTIAKVVGFIIDHREAIAIAFGAKMALPLVTGVAAPVLGGAGQLAGALVPAIGMGLKAFFAAGPGTAELAGIGATAAVGAGGASAVASSSIFQAMGATEAGFVGFLEVLAPAIAAVGGLAFAAYELHGLWGDLSKDEQMTIDAETKFQKSLRDASFTNKDYQQVLGGLIEKAREHDATFWGGLQKAGANIGWWSDSMDTLAAKALNAAMWLDVMAKEAREAQDKRDDEFATTAVDRSLEGMTAASTNTAKDFLAGRGKFAKVDNVNFNLNGGQTFHIKQEFRNGDPDRVLIAFRQDVVNQAMNRKQARLGSPFG